MGFLTAASICSTSVLIGVLATSALWDATILFGVGGPVTEQTIRTLEAYYLTWWNGAQVVKTFLHVMLLLDYAALIFKFARKGDEAAFYFSGGSLFALVLATSCYITITVPYVRNIAHDPLDPSKKSVGEASDFFTRMQGLMQRTSTGVVGKHAREVAEKAGEAAPMSWQERLEHDSVLSASNTIIMVFLMGVIVLQLGEWYVAETVTKEANAAPVVAVSEERKNQ